MSDRLVKCYGEDCLEKDLKYKKSTMTIVSGKRHCPSCAQKKQKEVNDREDLYHFIMDAYRLSFPTGNMLRQIKTFREERSYTYKNIRLTLNYVFNVKKVYKPIIKFGIAFVPHFYDEMIEYYKDLQYRRLNTVVKKTTVKRVKVKTPDLETNKYREKKLIDMEEI